MAKTLSPQESADIISKRFADVVVRALKRANVDMEKAKPIFVRDAPEAVKTAFRAGKSDMEKASFGMQTKKPTKLQETAFFIGFDHAACEFAKQIISQIQ